MEWVYMAHPDVDGVTRVPSRAAEAHAARGWVVTDAPADEVFVPRTQPPAERQWLDMRHPSGGVQRLPNNAAALAEAERNGWRPAEEPEPAPETKKPKAAAARRSPKNEE